MKISASGAARNGMTAIRERKNLNYAKVAISCLHDGLVGVLQGKISVEKARELFCVDDKTSLYGDLLTFEEKDKGGG